MEIKQEIREKKLLLSLSGNLDTRTAPKLEKVISENYIKINELILDFKDLNYISSAGLRILLVSKKKLFSVNGDVYIENASYTVREILKITGFNTLFEINTGRKF